MVYKVKRFARLSTIQRNLNNWGLNGEEIPSESSYYPLKEVTDLGKMYNDYNVAWYDPDKVYVNSFKLIEPFSPRFTKQMNLLDPISYERLMICIGHLRNGEFVYTDDDITQDNNSIYYGSDPIYHEWDTQTHFLHDKLDMSKMDELPYSKHLNKKDRLTYGVRMPELINGKYVCKIRLSNCIGHKFDNSRY